MITALIIVASLAVLLFLVKLAKGHGAALETPKEALSRLRPVDVQAFQNLTSREEEEFLRENLSWLKFQGVQRARQFAALEYVVSVAHNAALLVTVGEITRRSSDPSVAEAGEKLLDSAIRLRFSALQAMAKLYVGLVFPFRNSVRGLAERYEGMTLQARVLGRLQDPAHRTTTAI